MLYSLLLLPRLMVTGYQSYIHRAFWPGATSWEHICHIKRQIMFSSYRVLFYTPGWRAAMWIMCLAEGQKVAGIGGNHTRNPLIQSQWFNPIYHGTIQAMKTCFGTFAKFHLGLLLNRNIARMKARCIGVDLQAFWNHRSQWLISSLQKP